jgi:putative pre-16S rRNA nuclease
LGFCLEVRVVPEAVRGQILGFDFGLRQIGVASTHTDLGIVSPVSVLSAKNGRVNPAEVVALVKEWRPKALVVGLPINMDGTESELSKRARHFANWLGEVTAMPIEMVDERLTSREAKAMASEQGHSGDYRRQPVDAIAACLILEQWIGNRPKAT